MRIFKSQTFNSFKMLITSFKIKILKNPRDFVDNNLTFKSYKSSVHFSVNF